jgi:hypothetical protein
MRTRLVMLSIAVWPAVVAAQTPQQSAPQQSAPQPSPQPQRAVLSAASNLEADPRQSQVQAATANGIAKLREQVLGTKISRSTTVGDFLARAQATDDLKTVLDSAQPVGGPRWLDDQTCQVRMELPGQKVSAFLVDVARDQSRHAGVKPEALAAKLADWKGLKFTGVGCSSGGESVDLAEPHDAVGRWSEVSDSARRKAIAQARADAVQKVIHSIGSFTIDGKTPVSDALAEASIAGHLHDWLARQPVTKIDFLDDLNVSVTVSVTPAALSAAVRSAIAADSTFSRKISVDGAKLDTQMQTLPASYTGLAPAAIAGAPTSLPSVVLPLTPPDWVDQQLDAEGVASGRGDRLKLSLAAQKDAVAKLRVQFQRLNIDSTSTLGDAARTDPALNQAIDRAMKQAHTSVVTYNTDGSVHVKISLDLKDAWEQLRANP